MRCTSFFGRHDWDSWIRNFGSPRKLEHHDGLWRQEVQRRTCLTCEYNQHEWLPTWQPLKEESTDKDQNDDDPEEMVE